MAHKSRPGSRRPTSPSAAETYTRLWFGVWGVVVAVGAALACVLWPPGSVLVGLFTPVAVAAATVTVSWLSGPDHVPVPSRARAHAAIRNGVTAGLVMVATLAGLRSTPTVVGALLLLAATTSPWALAFAVRWSHTYAGPAARPVPDLPAAEPDPGELACIKRLTDADLCRRWRYSFFDLASASNQPERARVVQLRQAYLDELERRDPDAFVAWLDSQPRAASGPEQFLRGHGDDTPEAGAA